MRMRTGKYNACFAPFGYQLVGGKLELILEQAPIIRYMTAALTEWDEEVIHQLLEKVTVLSQEKIRVTFRDGREIEQYVAQPKRRKLA